MKMSTMMYMAVIVGMGIMGYTYLKEHPEIINKMMEMKKDAMNSIDNMMDE